MHNLFQFDKLILLQITMKMQKCESAPKCQVNKEEDEDKYGKNLPIYLRQISKISDDVRKHILKAGKLRRSLNINKNRLFRTRSNKISQNKSWSTISPTKQYFSVNFRHLALLDSEMGNLHRTKQKIFHESNSIQNIQSITNKYLTNQLTKIKKQYDVARKDKRKLTPIKKKLCVQPKIIVMSEMGNFRSTFLNIEKLSLTKLRSKIDEFQDNKLKKNCSIGFAHQDKNSIGESDLSSTTNSNNLTLFIKSSYSSSPVKQKKMKPQLFCPPFEKYHYRDFIWKCAYSFNVYHEGTENYQKKFKVFIDKGNNSMLIKSLIQKRKDWLTLTEHFEQANFIWTQIKINTIFDAQHSHQSIYDTSSTNCLIHRQTKSMSSPKQNYKQNKKILSEHEYSHWQQYFSSYYRVETKLDQKLSKRNQIFTISNKKHNCKELTKIDLKQLKIHNHLPNNYIISNKKALFYTMSAFYEKTKQNVFEFLPLTFHIQNGIQDPQYFKFLNSYYERAKTIRAQQKNSWVSKTNPEQKQQGFQQEHFPNSSQGVFENIWIVKPGEFTNRGNGITVCLSLQEIKSILKRRQRDENGNYKTYIVQSYIEKPFLYQKRKFDIRHYMMIVSINGIIKGYWYQLGYIRTTSFEYSTKNGFTSVHLTNDAVQKYLPQYGKYEKGNKISYEQFQRYLRRQYDGCYNFYTDVFPRMKKIATDSIKACAIMIDPQKKGHNFEIFGMDFMIDADFHPWLIQINNNPCLQLSCPLLAQIIPPMVENAFKICLDSMIPPPTTPTQQKQLNMDCKTLEQNKFELVYNSATEEQEIIKLFNGKTEINLNYEELQKEQSQLFDDDEPLADE